MSAHHEHRAAAPRHVRCAVLTISDTRSIETDTGGALLSSELPGAGHEVVVRQILRDEPDDVRARVRELAEDPRIDAILTTGGTGITSRDSTYEAIEGLLEKRLDGFGELFRFLSYAEVGPAAMLSRATAGALRGKILIALPGSPDAVRLALSKLVLPELGHMVEMARR
ncbi:MAG: molybdenum cofactor biosynthesis protein MoaB [Deltaproteobacteria bacterium]|nr:molybdenum cofactor biosynthesis protein MoaB [Deltaproteobacteria bacterium]